LLTQTVSSWATSDIHSIIAAELSTSVVEPWEPLVIGGAPNFLIEWWNGVTGTMVDDHSTTDGHRDGNVTVVAAKTYMSKCRHQNLGTGN
jgi:hypothetical protein